LNEIFPPLSAQNKPYLCKGEQAKYLFAQVVQAHEREDKA